MSDVRVSSSSPSVEWMDGRQGDQLPKSSACRVLFGQRDHQETLRDLDRQNREHEDAFRERWNFDPLQDRPLPGKMQWTEVPKDEVPEYYSRPYSRKGPWALRIDVNGNCSENCLSIAGHLQGDGGSGTTGEGCNSTRKRHSTEDSSSPPCKSSTSDADSADRSSTVEQTPRKSNPRQHQT